MAGNDDYYLASYYDYDHMEFHVTSIHPGWSLLLWTSLYTALCVLVGFFFKCRKRKYRKEWDTDGQEVGIGGNANTNGTYVSPSAKQNEGVRFATPQKVDGDMDGQQKSSSRSCFGTEMEAANACGAAEVLDNVALFDLDDSLMDASFGSDNSSKAYELWETIFGPDQDGGDKRKIAENGNGSHDPDHCVVNSPIPNLVVSGNNIKLDEEEGRKNKKIVKDIVHKIRQKSNSPPNKKKKDPSIPDVVANENYIKLDEDVDRKNRNVVKGTVALLRQKSILSPKKKSPEKKSDPPILDVVIRQKNCNNQRPREHNLQQVGTKFFLDGEEENSGPRFTMFGRRKKYRIKKRDLRSVKGKKDKELRQPGSTEKNTTSQTSGDYFLDQGHNQKVGLKCSMLGRRNNSERTIRSKESESNEKANISVSIQKKRFDNSQPHRVMTFNFDLEEGNFRNDSDSKGLNKSSEACSNLEYPCKLNKSHDPYLNSLSPKRPSSLMDTSGQGGDTYKNEMKQMYDLAAPWVFSSFVEYAASIVTIALISNYMSVGEMIAYSYVWFILEAAHLICSALYNSLYKHVNNAVAMESEEGCDKAGKYIRIGVFINLFLSIPASIGVVFGMESIMRMYGYEEKMVELCSHYTIVAVIDNFTTTTFGLVSCMTEIDGHADFNAMYTLVDSLVSIAIAAFVIPFVRPSLVQLGLIHMAHEMLSYLVYFYLTWHRKGWFDDYKKGMMTPIKFEREDKKAIATLIKKTIPLTVDELNGEIEWLVLTYFAAYMGTAESVSWILLSYIEEVTEIFPYCIGSAAEYRISNQLSKGNIILAQQMAKTAMILSSMSSFIAVSILFLFRVPIVNAMTNNDALANMLVGVMPYLLICNPLIDLVAMAGYLNRSLAMYQRSTKIELFITCFITIPAAWIATYKFGYDISGLVAANFIGYASMGVVILAIYMNADWEKAVRKNRKIAGIIEPKQINGQGTSSKENWISSSDNDPLNDTAVCSTSSDESTYSDYDWDELPANAKSAAKILGYDKKLWDKGKDTEYSDYDWTELPDEQKTAAGVLGYSQKNWDH